MPATLRNPQSRGGQSPAHLFGRLMARDQGPEQQQIIPFAINQRVTSNPLNLDRPMNGVHLVFSGRNTIAVNPFVAQAPESPQGLINWITISGQHKQFGPTTLWDMSGASTFAYPALYGVPNSLYINNVRMPVLSTPMGVLVATFGAVGAFDFLIHYWIPFTPLYPGNASTPKCWPFALQPDEWLPNSLKVQILFGDQTSFGTPGAGTTSTFTAFGGAGGTVPTVTIEADYWLAGDLQGKTLGALLLRGEVPNQTLVNAVGSGALISNLDQVPTAGVIVKAGTILAGTTTPDVFATLSDVQLSQTQIIAGAKPVKNILDNQAAKEQAARRYRTIPPQGYVVYPFIDSGDPLACYRGDLGSAAKTFALKTGVLTAAANNRVNFIQEKILCNVDPASSALVWGLGAGQ
jgi:hypothetical protein